MTIADMKQMLGGVKALPKHLFKIPIIQYIKKNYLFGFTISWLQTAVEGSFLWFL